MDVRPLVLANLNRFHFLEKAMKICNNKYWSDRDRSEFRNKKTVSVEFDALRKVFKTVAELEKKVQEYELRPPLIGGRLFREARDRFKSSTSRTV